MSNLHFFSMGSYFTAKDIEDFKSLTQVNYEAAHFSSDSFWTITGKQDLKAVLSELFRVKGCPKACTNSRDNWYAYIDGRNTRFVCLYNDIERNNALVDVMNFIKRSTGFNVPYLLIRFDIDLHIEEPRQFTGEDGSTVSFAFQPLKVSEKYMQYLGFTAASRIKSTMEQLRFPRLTPPHIVQALITDEIGEQWHFYILVPQGDTDLASWVPPEELMVP